MEPGQVLFLDPALGRGEIGQQQVASPFPCRSTADVANKNKIIQQVLPSHLPLS